MPLAHDWATPPGGFGWSKALGSTLDEDWWAEQEVDEGQFIFQAVYRGDFVAGAQMYKGKTEFASIPRSTHQFMGSAAALQQFLNQLPKNGGKGRVIDIRHSSDDPDLPINAIVVPNSGSVERKSWWGHDATAQEISHALEGKAWSGHAADGIKKKIVSIDRAPDGRFLFVLNELAPGDAWWWGFGASLADVEAVFEGKAWADFKADGIKKRLVSLKRFEDKDDWTFLMIPWEPDVAWWLSPALNFHDITKQAQQHHARIISLERDGSSNDLFTAIMVGNHS
jgi:hypothetical protein